MNVFTLQCPCSPRRSHGKWSVQIEDNAEYTHPYMRIRSLTIWRDAWRKRLMCFLLVFAWLLSLHWFSPVLNLRRLHTDVQYIRLSLVGSTRAGNPSHLVNPSLSRRRTLFEVLLMKAIDLSQERHFLSYPTEQILADHMKSYRPRMDRRWMSLLLSNAFYISWWERDQSMSLVWSDYSAFYRGNLPG